jgi:hypothetical protein
VPRKGNHQTQQFRDQTETRLDDFKPTFLRTHHSRGAHGETRSEHARVWSVCDSVLNDSVPGQ